MSELDRENEDIYAGLAAGGAAGAGILAGAKSRTANKDTLRMAKDLYNRRVRNIMNPEQRAFVMSDIWRQTGWFQGPDGNWKYEIPEAGAKYTFQQSEAQLEPPPDWTSTGILNDAERPLGVRMQGPLSTFLDFPELYNAYPGIENMQTGQLRLPENIRGVFQDQLGAGVSHLLNPEQAASTLTHELQHAIQGLEGFNLGGNPEDVGQLFPGEAQNLGVHETYRRLGGEAEARMVQSRLMEAMNGPRPEVNELLRSIGAEPEPVYSRFPLWDYDVSPLEQLIYSKASTMPFQGPINNLQLPMTNEVRLLPDSLPPAHALTAEVPKEALGDVGARLMALLKRAL